MKAISIFTCWATVDGGVVQRIEVRACSQRDAVRDAFRVCPRAVRMSCWPVERVSQARSGPERRKD